MEDIITILKEINIAQLAVIAGMMWAMYSRLDAKIDKLDSKIDRLEERVNDIDKRLCRIEGSLSTQGHCLFHQKQEDRKAE